MAHAFRLLDLPAELAYEIIRLAASPLPTPLEIYSRTFYSTALTLARVCHEVRMATMPYLLHTVVLRSSIDITLFTEAARLQKRHRTNKSRLAVDYQRLVRRLWSTECHEPLVNDSPMHAIDCHLLWELMRGAHTLGIHFSSLHLLSGNLAEFPNESILPHRRVIFAGSTIRWNPIIYTAQGLAFFAQISHLIIWDIEKAARASSRLPDRFPKWLVDVPLNHLPNLTHFAFPLMQANEKWNGRQSVDMAIYIIPRDRQGLTLRNWLRQNHLNFACISLQLPHYCSDDAQWEMAFLERKDEEIWLQAEKMLTSTRDTQVFKRN